MLATWTDVEIADELLTDVRVAAALTLFPRIRRYLEPLATRGAELFFFPEPGHLLKCDCGGLREQPLRRTTELRTTQKLSGRNRENGGVGGDDGALAQEGSTFPFWGFDAAQPSTVGSRILSEPNSTWRTSAYTNTMRDDSHQELSPAVLRPSPALLPDSRYVAPPFS